MNSMASAALASAMLGLIFGDPTVPSIQSSYQNQPPKSAVTSATGVMANSSVGTRVVSGHFSVTGRPHLIARGHPRTHARKDRLKVQQAR
jgi:hypothetical protein